MIILLVEDDRQLATITANYLNDEGIEVDYADSISSAKVISSEQQYDAIVLDLELPDGFGFELAREFSISHKQTPILFLTAQHCLEAKLRAFELGALDYLTKPFELAELSVRLKLLGRKHHPQPSEIFHLDTLTVDLSAHIATRALRPITLSPQQWCLLKLLIRHSPNPVSKHTVIEHVWQHDDVSPDMYKSLLSRLRKNLSQGHELELFHTIKGVGVLLDAK